MVLIGSVFAADNRDGWAGGRQGDSGRGKDGERSSRDGSRSINAPHGGWGEGHTPITKQSDNSSTDDNVSAVVTSYVPRFFGYVNMFVRA